ncbi:MAG: rod shape-determining protein [Thermotogae bacterium]|nr:rod shape-determining protein [Thermotogota bacterium]
MRGFIKKIRKFFKPAIAIDLGTSTTLIYLKGEGIVLEEASVIAIDAETKEIVAVGNEAKKMLGKTHSGLIAKRPIKDGVIHNLEYVQMMLGEFRRRVIRNFIANPTMLMAVPSGANDVERKATIDAAKSVGASHVFLIEEPVASAVGIGLDVFEPRGHMIVDIGGGTSEIAIISLAGVVAKQPIRVAGDEMNEAIADHIRRTYNIAIDENIAEQIKIRIGDVYGDRDDEMVIKGWEVFSRKPTEITIRSSDVKEALKGVIDSLAQAIRKVLDMAEPSVVKDVLEEGIYLTGGGSTIHGLDKRLEEETGVKFIRAKNPHQSVVMGAGSVLENLDRKPVYKKLLIAASR